jgi:hypothetical protein
VREGQVVFRVSVYSGDPKKDVLLGVVMDGQRKLLEFSPAKGVTMPQYLAESAGSLGEGCTPF